MDKRTVMCGDSTKNGQMDELTNGRCEWGQLIVKKKELLNRGVK